MVAFFIVGSISFVDTVKRISRLSTYVNIFLSKQTSCLSRYCNVVAKKTDVTDDTCIHIQIQVRQRCDRLAGSTMDEVG